MWVNCTSSKTKYEITVIVINMVIKSDFCCLYFFRQAINLIHDQKLVFTVDLFLQMFM